MTGWKPIATAPRDGSVIVVFIPAGRYLNERNHGAMLKHDMRVEAFWVTKPTIHSKVKAARIARYRGYWSRDKRANRPLFGAPVKWCAA